MICIKSILTNLLLYLIKHFKMGFYTINKPLYQSTHFLNLINVLTIYISNLILCKYQLKLKLDV